MKISKSMVWRRGGLVVLMIATAMGLCIVYFLNAPHDSTRMSKAFNALTMAQLNIEKGVGPRSGDADSLASYVRREAPGAFVHISPLGAIYFADGDGTAVLLEPVSTDAPMAWRCYSTPLNSINAERFRRFQCVNR